MINKVRREFTGWQKVNHNEAEKDYNFMSEEEFNKIFYLMGNTYFRKLYSTDEEIKLIKNTWEAPILLDIGHCRDINLWDISSILANDGTRIK